MRSRTRVEGGGAGVARRVRKRAGQAIADFGLISDGDHVMVCVSGGKDSYALLDVLLEAQRRAPIDFTLTAVNIDQGWPGYDTDAIRAHLEGRGVAFRMVRDHGIADTVERVLDPARTGATPCSLCSRLRRGVVYRIAGELGATKIALGHHLDDLAETLLLNLFFAGALRTMPAKLVSSVERDGTAQTHVVIRPLAYVEERDLIEYAAEQAYPVVRCSCPTCGLPDQERQVIKRMLAQLASEHPQLKTHMLAAMQNVDPTFLLDRTLQAANA